MSRDGSLTDKQRSHYIALCLMAKDGLKGGAEEMAFLSTLSAYVDSHLEPALADLRERIARELEALARPKPNSPKTPEAALASATQQAAASTVRTVSLFGK